MFFYRVGYLERFGNLGGNTEEEEQRADGGQAVEQAEETQQLADGAGAGAVEEVVEDSWQLLGKFHIGDAGDLQLQLCFSLHHSFSLWVILGWKMESGYVDGSTRKKNGYFDIKVFGF